VLILFSIFATSCAKNWRGSEHEESGMFSEKIRIRTLPTKAKIFINEREVGESPFTYIIRHEEKRMLNIKAVPIYPNQYTQNIFLMVPPIPKTMTIYMNHFPEDYDRSKDIAFTPPEKPAPEIIVQTEVDTIYVEHHTKEQITYTLPIIYFDTASYSLYPSEEQKLQELSDFLKQNQSFVLDIYGFADHRASDQYNVTLTLNRAKAVRDYLVRNGIDSGRLFSYGHGRVSKVSTEGLELDLQENRKVIFLLRENR
jgi:outer membrane protein OmpA-like peptidoglycan-associated protein